MKSELLIVDLRTPFHVLEYQRIQKNQDIRDRTEVLIIAPHGLSLKGLVGEYLYYEFSPTSYKSILKIKKFCKLLHKKIRVFSSISLCTAINFGPLFDVLVNTINIQNISLFEDGISSYLKLYIKKPLLKKFLYSFILIKKIKLASKQFFWDDAFDYEAIYSDKAYHCSVLEIKSKVITYRCLEGDLHEAVNETRTFFLSSSSVEYGLLTIDEYRSNIRDLKARIGERKLIVSFHHNEKFIHKKMNIIKEFFNISAVLDPSTPVEQEIFKGDFKVELICPYNSVALSACYKSLIERMVLYDDKGPNSELRKSLFKETSPNFRFGCTFL